MHVNLSCQMAGRAELATESEKSTKNLNLTQWSSLLQEQVSFLCQQVGMKAETSRTMARGAKTTSKEEDADVTKVTAEQLCSS